MNNISYEVYFIVIRLVVRKIVHVDEEKCNGCGQCIPNCAEGALKILNGKARLVSSIYCDGLGACLGHCPQDAISIIEREAPEFDEEAVQEYLKQHELISGFSSNVLQEQKEAVTKQSTTVTSKLRHWPVQLNLVPVKANFFDDSNLLLMSDCVSVALPDLHDRLLKGKSVIIGCPKFDDVQHYVEKLTDILCQNNIMSMSVAIMEVPCCSGLRGIAYLALEASGKMIPCQTFVVSVDGCIRS